MNIEVLLGKFLSNSESEWYLPIKYNCSDSAPPLVSLVYLNCLFISETDLEWSHQSTRSSTIIAMDDINLYSMVWSPSPPLITLQDLHHLVVLVACWNSHSRTAAWLAFQWRYAQIYWILLILLLQCSVFSVHTNYNIHTITTTLGGTHCRCWNNFSSSYFNYANTCGRSSKWIPTICLKLMRNTSVPFSS